MASVNLDFTVPNRPDITKLHIYEAATSAGPFAEIEVVTNVGVYPDYITQYTTSLATSISNWFRIEWEDSKGARYGRSEAVQGGVTSLVADIVSRILLRDPTINEQVALEEAEGVLEMLYGTTAPASADVGANARSGITLQTMARVYLTPNLSQGDESFTAGLVSITTKRPSNMDISSLLQEAARRLNLNPSRVAQMAELPIAGGFSRVVSGDISRLIVEVE